MQSRFISQSHMKFREKRRQQFWDKKGHPEIKTTIGGQFDGEIMVLICPTKLPIPFARLLSKMLARPPHQPQRWMVSNKIYHIGFRKKSIILGLGSFEICCFHVIWCLDFSGKFKFGQNHKSEFDF